MKAVILTGGKSRRMGQDKAELSLGGIRLVDHVHARLVPQSAEILISGQTGYGLGLRVINDRADGPKGPAGGLYAVYQALEAEASVDDGFFTVPVDAPQFPLDLCEKLYGPSSAIALAPDGTHQAFAWWALSDLRTAFQALDFETSISLKRVATLCSARAVFWPDESLFLNLNTPEDVGRFDKTRLDVCYEQE
ncbi:MAG: molybdenum cofactor guanylyltransferase [Alphaproteobacteria bacterium]